MRKCALFFTLLIATLIFAISLPEDNENLKPYTISKNKEVKQKLIKKDSTDTSRKRMIVKKTKQIAMYRQE